MGRTRRPFHAAGERLFDYASAGGSLFAAHVHLLVVRGKHRVHPRLAAEANVPVQVAGVARKILLRSKLRGIDVNANDHLSGGARQSPGPPDQAQMARVQITHGGHQADSRALPAPAQGLPLHGLNRPDDSHGQRVRQRRARINLNLIAERNVGDSNCKHTGWPARRPGDRFSPPGHWPAGTLPIPPR